MSHTETRGVVAGAIAGLAVATLALLSVLTVACAGLGAPATEPVRLSEPTVTVTITPPDTTHQWIDCYQDPDTERWVPNLAIPAPGECP